MLTVPVVRSTNVAVPKPAGGRARRRTGIDKHPTPQIEVFTPGPSYGDGGGVVGDLVGDEKHHGGAHKAVYAFSRSELDRWEAELGRPLRDGWFGENLTVDHVDLEGLRINQRLRIVPASRDRQAPEDEVVLEVSVPRTPCSTFAIHMAEPGWTKAFAQRGRCGVYLRVIRPGIIRPGDRIEVLPPPDHDVTMRIAFAAAMGDDDAAAEVVSAGCYPAMYHDRLVRRLADARG
ncbi:MOSC domain-containing protein [Ornithinimicrobium panacihumi]|uniref:MOSC domain-containing protein n=1 Tax=Ornithinimicrobium panacihumi TaxID=2008449 RepID=UPI003F8AD0C7